MNIFNKREIHGQEALPSNAPSEGRCGPWELPRLMVVHASCTCWTPFSLLTRLRHSFFAFTTTTHTNACRSESLVVCEVIFDELQILRKKYSGWHLETLSGGPVVANVAIYYAKIWINVPRSYFSEIINFYLWHITFQICMFNSNVKSIYVCSLNTFRARLCHLWT